MVAGRTDFNAQCKRQHTKVGTGGGVEWQGRRGTGNRFQCHSVNGSTLRRNESISERERFNGCCLSESYRVGAAHNVAEPRVDGALQVNGLGRLLLLRLLQCLCLSQRLSRV